MDIQRRSWALQFLIDWEGYGTDEHCWMPCSFILDPELITPTNQVGHVETHIEEGRGGTIMSFPLCQFSSCLPLQREAGQKSKPRPRPSKSHCPYCDSDNRHVNACRMLGTLSSDQIAKWLKEGKWCRKCACQHTALQDLQGDALYHLHEARMPARGCLWSSAPPR